MSNDSIQDELSKYMSLWATAQENMPELSPSADDQSEDDLNLSAIDLYTERKNSSGNSSLEVHDMLLLSEDLDKIFKSKDKGDEVSKISVKAASSHNPVELQSVGPDQDVRVTQNFTDGEALRQLHDLKIKIESLERELHAASVNGTEKEENKLNKEMASIRSKIDEISDKLRPHRVVNPE